MITEMGRKTTFSNMCRICMSTSITMDQQYIHEKPTDSGKDCPTIMEILLSVQPQIRVKMKDNLPKIMCRRCILQLQMAYNFLQMFKNSDDNYKKIQNRCNITAQREKRHCPGDKFKKNRRDSKPNTPNVGTIKRQLLVTENVSPTLTKIESSALADEACKADEINSDFSDFSYSDTSDSDWAPVALKSINQNYIENTAENRNTHTDEKKDDIVPPENETGSIPCQECETVLDNVSLWREHMGAYHKSTQQTKVKRRKDGCICEYCGKVFPKIAKVVQHIRTHTGEEPFLCLECGKGFKTQGCLKIHIMRHRGEKKVQCSHCPKRFVCSSDLQSHMMSHRKDKKHVCDVCGKAFHVPNKLREHKIHHDGIKKFSCEDCDKRFPTIVRLRRHMYTHTGERPYRCKYCDRGFTQSGDCNRHLKQHLGENIYQCEMCPQRFPFLSNLREHFASHKDDDEETRSRNLKAREEVEKNLKVKLILN